jgi:hypothetical protein
MCWQIISFTMKAVKVTDISAAVVSLTSGSWQGRKEMKAQDWNLHINILGWLYLVSSAFFLLLGILALVLMAGMGAITQHAEVFAILSILGIVGTMFFALLSLPGLLAGYGLLRRYSWARFLALIVAFFNLANFPVGSAIGVYTFVVLLQADIGQEFVSPKAA